MQLEALYAVLVGGRDLQPAGHALKGRREQGREERLAVVRRFIRLRKALERMRVEPCGVVDVPAIEGALRERQGAPEPWAAGRVRGGGAARTCPNGRVSRRRPARSPYPNGSPNTIGCVRRTGERASSRKLCGDRRLVEAERGDPTSWTRRSQRASSASYSEFGIVLVQRVS